MSVKNGYKGSWSQFSKYTGSVLIINLGSDLGLYPNEAPGLGGTYQLLVTVTGTNLNQSQAINAEITILGVSEGAYSIFENRAIAEIGIFGKSDVMNAKFDRNINYNTIKKMAPYGGDFFGFMKSLVGPALGMLPGGPILRGVTGLGMSGGKRKAKSSKLKMHLKRGRGVSGGDFMDNSELLDKLND